MEAAIAAAQGAKYYGNSSSPCNGNPLEAFIARINPNDRELFKGYYPNAIREDGKGAFFKLKMTSISHGAASYFIQNRDQTEWRPFMDEELNDAPITRALMCGKEPVLDVEYFKD